MSRSKSPTKPIRDERLAGEFAKKRLGKFAYARIRTVSAKRIQRNYKVYEVGVCSQVGEFVVKGDSSWDFSEAFERAGHPMRTDDPLFLQDDLREVNRICERESAKQEELSI